MTTAEFWDLFNTDPAVNNEAATSGGTRRFDGWYPKLFYKNIYDEVDLGADKFDAIVTDVHTDFPDVISGDPGTVLHQGGVHFLLIAIERENERKAIYGGPVLSYYEFDTGENIERRTNEAWQEQLLRTSISPESWTGGYLVPSGAPVQNPYE